MRMKMSTGIKENKQFRILSALGIIFVVAGHLGFYVFEFGGLFPHYSFHVFIFLLEVSAHPSQIFPQI